MRKFFSILLVCAMLLGLVGSPVMAQSKNVTLTFEWEQTISADFYGWKMWYSFAPGGPYIQLGSDIVYDGTPAAIYTCDETITADDGAETTFYFVVSAADISGNESGYSNEVSYLADFLPPNVPVTLTVTVKSTP